MHVHRNATVLNCAICERTLLLGERAAGYRAHGTSQTVCELCVDVADRRGWLRAGAPEPPPVAPAGGRGPGLFGRVAAAVRGARPAAEPVLVDDLPPDPATRRSAPLSGAAHDGVEAFNDSPYRRTVSGISKSLGAPRVSVVPLPGTRPDVVVTVAWEISWYQYRVDAAGGGIRLEGRGDDPDDLDERWQRWNARLADDGRLAVAV